MILKMAHRSALPPLFGLIAQCVSLALYPYYMMLFSLLMLIMTELLFKITHKEK